MNGMTKEVIDAKDECYWNDTTALMNAAERGHRKIVELLLEKGADVDLRRGCPGWQAIHLATYFGHLDVIKLIAKSHPEVLNARTNRLDETPLDIAIRKGHTNIKNWLLNEKNVTK